MPPLLDPIASTSPLSSVDSFVTATASPSNPQDITVTDISDPDEVGGGSPYCKARQLPPELRDHCQIFLEENLPIFSLGVLNSLLSPNHHGKDKENTIYIPPPNQLSVLSTLLVHPDFTTRPRERSWSAAPTESLIYLRSLLSLVGPLNAKFEDAFRFGGNSRYSRGATPRSESTDSEWDDDDKHGRIPLGGKYGKDSVWARGQDFFYVVGWAFNCSVLYPNRWRYWKEWLDFVLDVLEADLHERHRLDTESRHEDLPMLQKSILATYVSQRTSRNAGGLKWITKAIFADGSNGAVSVFQEIWHKEHKGVSKNVLNKRKRVTVNIEKGDFGGWLDDDSVYSSQASEPPTPQKRKTNSGNIGSEDFQALEPAYVESMPLRQRLFSLISYLCFHLPEPPLSLSELYESFEDTARSLPLPIFSALINSSTSSLRLDSQISLYQGILAVLMPSSALNPAKVDRARFDAGGLSPAIIERCYLPYPANTIAVEDNAKVSLLVENLVQIVLRDGTEAFSAGFRKAVETGIQARETKARKKKTAGRGGRGRGGASHHGSDDDDEARMVLELSSERLRVLADIVNGFDDERGDDEMDVEEDDDFDQTFMTAKSTGHSDGDGDETPTKSAGQDAGALLHCTCRRPSQGDMIACDNAECAVGWYHYECVGVRRAPRGRWFCPDCCAATAAAAETKNNNAAPKKTGTGAKANAKAKGKGK